MAAKLDGMTWRRTWIGFLAMALGLALAPSAALAQDEGDKPEITQGPTIVGTAHVGRRLDAQATWTSALPVTTEYRWRACDAPADDNDELECEQVKDGPEAFYVLSAADLGKRIVVRLTVRNDEGSDRVTSAPSAAVVAAPPPMPKPVPPKPATPKPAVPAPPAPSPAVRLRRMRPVPKVRISGYLTARGAMITRLSVRARRGVRISVRCRGRGCPRRSLARATKVTRLRAFEGHLRAGVRLEIRITRPGFVGKYTVIRIRRGKPPARRDRCVAPGSPGRVAC